MFGVFVAFDLGAAYDAARLSGLAQAALPKFLGMPGLISKTFTLDDEARRAVNFYVWESEAAARAFFSEATLDWVTGVTACDRRCATSRSPRAWRMPARNGR